MYGHIIVRAHRQHQSVVMTIPVLVRRQLGIEAGDYLLLTTEEGSDAVQMNKFVGKDGRDAKGIRVAGREDQGRRPRAEDGGGG